MPELNFDRWTGPLIIEYAGTCPHFGQDVPADFWGCSECPVARMCYQVWELSERSENVRYKLRSTEV